MIYGDHLRKIESPSFDSLNERFYVSDNIPKTFLKIPMGTCEETSLKLFPHMFLWEFSKKILGMLSES